MSGIAASCGSRASTEARTSETSSPAKRRRPVSISNSTTPNAQMSAALVDRLALRLLGTHVRGRAQNDAGRVIAGVVIVGDCE